MENHIKNAATPPATEKSNVVSRESFSWGYSDGAFGPDNTYQQGETESIRDWIDGWLKGRSLREKLHSSGTKGWIRREQTRGAPLCKKA